MRINKFIAAAGAASRRGADALIEEGRVSINGRVAVCGDRVSEQDEVCLDGRVLELPGEKVILAYNKPSGVVCSSVSQGKNEVNIIDAVNYPRRLFCIGRLDKDSRGLILLSDDGDLADRIMRACNFHEKEYEVTVDREITDDFLLRLSSGVDIGIQEGGTYRTRSCMVKRLTQRSFSITLTEGKNRQIRRMCEALGYMVVDLCRVRVMNFMLDGWPEGSYIEISEQAITSTPNNN